VFVQCRNAALAAGLARLALLEPEARASDVIGSKKERSNCLVRPGPPADWAGRWHIICER